MSWAPARTRWKAQPLAQSVVSYLRDKGATTFVATHFPELKLYASQTSGATNASLLFDMETLSPTYEMTIGLPGRSNAFAIARRLGLEDSVLDDAVRMVSADSHQAEDLLGSIYSLREKIEADEARTRLTLREAEAERDALQQRLELMEEEREQVIYEARQEMQRQIELLQAEIRQVRSKLRDAASLSAVKRVSKQAAELEEAQQQAVAAETARDKPEPQTRPKVLQVGDTVLVRSLNTKGEIMSLGRQDALVAVGRLQMRAAYDDLEFKTRAEQPPEAAYSGATVHPSPGMELDIRGMRVEEGVEKLARYLDSAYLARLPYVRIIHGKGTGRLRIGRRDVIRQSKHARTWEEGKDSEGGAGVTVVHLEEND
ncbi:MAG: Smr/MutS family protein [Chloroflexota bacterium]